MVGVSTLRGAWVAGGWYGGRQGRGACAQAGGERRGGGGTAALYYRVFLDIERGITNEAKAERIKSLKAERKLNGNPRLHSLERLPTRALRWLSARRDDC